MGVGRVGQKQSTASKKKTARIKFSRRRRSLSRSQWTSGRKKEVNDIDGDCTAEVNQHAADASASTAAQYAEEEKSTYTCDDASARPASGRAAACHTEERISTRQLKSTNTYDDASARPTLGRVAAHHTEERTTMKRPASLQLIPTRDIQLPTDKVLPPSTSRSPESSTMGFHARELAELQQRPETVEDQPRRVSAEVR